MQRQMNLEGGGSLTVREEGSRIHLYATRPDDRRGLYKVWLRGQGGKMLLGTLVPERGALHLTRMMSKGALEQGSCWPILGGEVVLAYSFGQIPQAPDGRWRWEDRPQRLLQDPILIQAASACQGMYFRQMEEGFQLAHAFSTREEFPMTPLFCLGRVQMVGTRQCVVWDFEKNGTPRYKW